MRIELMTTESQPAVLPLNYGRHYALVDDAGVEPATFSVSRKYSSTEIIVLGAATWARTTDPGLIKTVL